jgi:hypothetical protein
MKKLLVLLSLLFITSPVFAGGIYHNNTIYNLNNVLSVTRHSNNTVTIRYINKTSETVKYKNKFEAKRFFDAAQVVIL